MSKKKITKVLILLVVLGLILIQTCRVGATSLNAIIGEDGGSTSLNVTNDNNNTTNNTTTNTTNNTTNKVANTTNNTNTSLPKTGANENIIIGLMIVCTLIGVYAFKKVKDYNM